MTQLIGISVSSLFGKANKDFDVVKYLKFRGKNRTCALSAENWDFDCLGFVLSDMDCTVGVVI